jgi:ATP-dependent DNA ligase
MLWRVSRPIRSRSRPPGFIQPCQPALADRPPAGPGWLHEIKFDGYRVIGRKDGDQVRLWARTTTDYSKAFTRIRDAVAALPVDIAVLDGEAILLRPDNTSDFDNLRSRQGRSWSPMTWIRGGRAPRASGGAQEAGGAPAIPQDQGDA